MNYLSWLIYMADVSNTVNWLCYLAVLPIVGWGVFEAARFNYEKEVKTSVVTPTDLSDWYRRRNNAYSRDRDDLDEEMEKRLRDLVEAKAVELAATPSKKQRTLGKAMFKPAAT